MTDHTEMQIPDDVMEAARECLCGLKCFSGTALNEPFTCKFSTTYASYVS